MRSHPSRAMARDTDSVQTELSERLKRIPISAAKRIAEEYGYKQVVILARDPPNGGWVTTYGVTKTHCQIAGRMGNKLLALEKGELIFLPKSNRTLTRLAKVEALTPDAT